MLYRELGRTGIEVSSIGFGASPLGNVFGNISAELGSRAVAHAVEEGINVFDVSPYYGLTLAEERLGKALQGRRSSIYLATKCGRYGPESFDFSACTVVREVEASLRRLQTDHVDILQAHDIEFGNIEQLLGETLPAMVRLRQQGKIRFIGVTSYWPGLLARVIEQFDLDCVLNYCHSNLFANDMETVLTPVALQHGVGLFNASPLHMGLLSDSPAPAWHPAPREVQDAARDVCERVQAAGLDPATVGLHYCLQNTSVTSTFIGMSSPDEVKTAIAALDTEVPDELLRTVTSLIAPVHNTSWAAGLPENSDAGWISPS